MRTYAFAPRAQQDLQSQIDHLIGQGAFDAAGRLASRVEDFISQFLIHYPRSGAYIAHRELWETWIPRTRLVLRYRFTATELEIARVWHLAQDRGWVSTQS